MEIEILSDKEVLHPSEARGILVGRIQKIKIGDNIKTVKFWYDYNNPAVPLHHID